MQHQASITLTVILIIGTLINLRVSAAEEANPNEGYVSENFQLSDADLNDITSQVMAQHPLLSSSPGIKVAGATRHRRSQDVAEVLYFPHTESAGIKQAFQVVCERQVPETYWKCNEATIRRYVSLDSQEFEVRVRGPLKSEEVMALIEATRSALPTTLEDGSPSPRTATLIIPYRDGYLVAWGDKEGHGKLMMQALLPEGADPMQPLEWRANVYSYSPNE